MYRRFSWCCLAWACVAGLPADGRSAGPDADAVARRAWAITDVVLQQDVEPPSRQQMLLTGTRALRRQLGKDPSAELSRRISQVTSEDQFVAFLKEIWPQPREGAQPGEVASALYRGLLEPLPGARFLEADELRIEEQIRNNRYVGTGIQIRTDPKEKLVQIVTAFPGGPARRAGVKAGDLIVAVDGTDLHGATIRRVVDLIRGPEGSDVTLTVRQPGVRETRDLRMTRSVVPFETAVGHRRLTETSWDFRPDPAAPIAYVRFTGLRASTLQELRRLEGRLRQDGFRALVLDLRTGSGGDVHHAALVADGLLDGGVLWRVRDAAGRVKEYRADRDSLFRGWPIAALVNGPAEPRPDGEQDTSNALLAAALQDNGRAVIVGEPTGSDGFVTGLVPLLDGPGALRLRTGRAERAKPAAGPGARAWVVKPDQSVKLDAGRRDQLLVWFGEQERGVPGTGAKAPDDPQLAKALEVLGTALKKGKEATGF